MKKFLMSLSVILLSSTMLILADTTVTTTVNGAVQSKELINISFDGDNVILLFSDNSSVTSDMSEVTVALTYDEQSAIESIVADQTKATGVYNLNGQRIAETSEGLKHGIYIVDGQKVVVK